MPRLRLVRKIKEPLPEGTVALALSQNGVLIAEDSDGEDSDDEKGQAIELEDVGDSFTILPELRENVATHLAVSGNSGCGKSHWAGQYADAWREHNPGGTVICVSCDLEDDPAISCDLRISPAAAGELELDDLGTAGTLVIMDDCHGTDRETAAALQKFMRACHERGRKKHISTINISHRPTAGKETKSALCDLSGLVLFPALPPTASLIYVLQNYAGVDPALLKLLKKDRKGWGRAVFVNLSSPGTILGERKAMLIDNDQIAAAAGIQREKRRAKLDAGKNGAEARRALAGVQAGKRSA